MRRREPRPFSGTSPLEIHLVNRGRSAQDFDLEALGQAADGFSGSEIEEVVVSGLYGAFSRGGTVTTEALLAEISRTKPLSVTMAEHIEGLRAWARDRTVRAN